MTEEDYNELRWRRYDEMREALKDPEEKNKVKEM